MIPEILSSQTDYQVLRLIGEGGYGQVWHAVDIATATDVAIKVFKNINQSLKIAQACATEISIIR